jgi:hypothetical protein
LRAKKACERDQKADAEKDAKGIAHIEITIDFAVKDLSNYARQF